MGEWVESSLYYPLNPSRRGLAGGRAPETQQRPRNEFEAAARCVSVREDRSVTHHQVFSVNVWLVVMAWADG